VSTAQAPPALLNATQLAGLLGISRVHIWRLNRAGKLPQTVHLGRRAMWRADEVRQWIDAGLPSRERWVILKGSTQ